MKIIPQFRAYPAARLGLATPAAASAPRSQRGLSLIEVLVALVIFSFGLLGIAGLLLASLKSNQYSAQAVVATSLVKEYADIMQMLPSRIESTSDNSSTLYISATNGNQANSTDNAACTGATKDCTGADFAATMRDEWITRVRASLPSGRVEVCQDASPRESDGKLKAWGGCDATGDLTLVRIGWATKRANAGSTQLDDAWLTDQTRPKFAIGVLGNLCDYRITTC
jgi:type IV pilus assembly protein PilV